MRSAKVRNHLGGKGIISYRYERDFFMVLDNTISTPLYKQLEETLRKEIDSGKQAPGSRFPTENELSQSYQVSRVTVRKALDELSKQGYLTRKPGKGTFVAEKKIQRGLSGVLCYSDMCRVMGYTPGAKTIKVALEEPTEEQAELLELEKDEPMLVVERLRLADEKPVLLEINRFPEEFFFLFDKNLNDASLYGIIKAEKGIVFTQSSKTVEIVFANYQEAKYLGVTKGYPLLSIKSIVQDAAGGSKHLCHQLCIADKFKLMV